LGAKRNLLYAYEWYKKSMQAGFLNAEREIGRIEEKLSNV